MKLTLVSVLAIVLVSVCSAFAFCDTAGVWVTTAHQIRNVVKEEVRPEGNADINAAKQAFPELGSMVYAYILNRSGKPVSLEGLSLDGVDVKDLAKPPAYGAIWWRMQPSVLPPGMEGEIGISLRSHREKPISLEVRFTDELTLKRSILPSDPEARIAGIVFARGMGKAYVYIECSPAESAKSASVYMNGVMLGSQATWLSAKPAAGLLVLVVTPKKPFIKGRRYTFRVHLKSGKTAATIRAFTDLTTFGTYGVPDLTRIAGAGLNTFFSFGKAGKRELDAAQEAGVRMATHGYNPGDPTKEGIAGHRALAGYLLMDEPDCIDYGADPERPYQARIGTTAPACVSLTGGLNSEDSLTPVIITLDLTFTPWNYFVYGPIADITNPDCYPITVGWPVKAIREKAAVVKRATAPKPFTFVYQGSWEEFITPHPPWMGMAGVAERGREALVDKNRVRGFGRAPTPSEVRMQMLYAVGCGAKGLSSFVDSTEASGELLFHGSNAMPEIWQAIGRTSRVLRLVGPMIEISSPVDLVRSDMDKLWVSTLLCGEKGLLVTAVNEDVDCDKNGFKARQARNAHFSCPDLPWFKAKAVYRVEDGVLIRMKSVRQPRGIGWVEPILTDAALYLLVQDESLAQQLLRNAKTEKPVATQKGKELQAEPYLKGVRSRWK